MTRVLAIILLALVALPARAQVKPWGKGVVGSGAVQWVPPGLSRDGGAAFPITAGATGTQSGVTTAAFSTSAATTLCVARVGYGTFDGVAVTPIAVAWSGGSGCSTTWTKQIEGVGNSVYSGSVWTAACATQVVGRAVAVTGVASRTNTAIDVAVDCLLNASTTMGVTASMGQCAGSVAQSATMTGVTAGSWLFAATTGEAVPLAPVANMAEEDERDNGTSDAAAVGLNSTGTAGNILVGWSTASVCGGMGALEIKSQ